MSPEPSPEIVDNSIEFTCSCGTRVVRFVPVPPVLRCAGCQWLEETPMPDDEKAKLRAYLLRQGTIGP